jgi:hypothetical protein
MTQVAIAIDLAIERRDQALLTVVHQEIGHQD